MTQNEGIPQRILHAPTGSLSMFGLMTRWLLLKSGVTAMSRADPWKTHSEAEKEARATDPMQTVSALR